MRAPSQFELEAKLARDRTRLRLLTRPTAYASSHSALVTFPDAQIGCRAEYLPILVGHVYGFRGFVINDDGGDYERVDAVERVLGYDFENFVHFTPDSIFARIVEVDGRQVVLLNSTNDAIDPTLWVMVKLDPPFGVARFGREFPDTDVGWADCEKAFNNMSNAEVADIVRALLAMVCPPEET